MKTISKQEFRNWLQKKRPDSRLGGNASSPLRTALRQLSIPDKNVVRDWQQDFEARTEAHVTRAILAGKKDSRLSAIQALKILSEV